MTQLLVRTMTWEAEGVLSLDLVDPDRRPLPAWEPGAHLDLVVSDGLVRQYSLCGDPADRSRYRVAVLREPASRGGSRWVHERLRPGDLVEVRGPRNHFRLEDAAEYLFVAGGIGITPILPMLAAAKAPWRLVYGGRSRASMAFTAELARYGDRVTLVTGPIDLDAVLRPGPLVYCCGPAGLISAVEARCPAESLRVERFAAPEAAPLPAGAFEVSLAQTGRTIPVPAGQSVLDVLLDAGIDVSNDCREGICGSCETKVLAGEVDHRDFVLTERERCSGCTMMVCVSRARGDRLVLDL